MALARKDINPARPQDNPQSPQYDPAQAKADRGPAFQLGGVLSGGVSNSGSQSAAPATSSPPPVQASTAALDIIA